MGSSTQNKPSRAQSDPPGLNVENTDFKLGITYKLTKWGTSLCSLQKSILVGGLTKDRDLYNLILTVLVELQYLYMLALVKSKWLH